MEKIKNKRNNYFEKIINKYNLSISRKNPLVIFIDGRNVTKDISYNLNDETKNSINDIMERTVKYFTKELKCKAISGVDEVSFIIEDVKLLENKMKIRKKYKTQEIVSIFSQHFFEYFNKLNTEKKIYWHCKCQTIPKGKVNSYIKYRSVIIFNLFTTYFLKKNLIKNPGKIKEEKRIELCNNNIAYEQIKEYEFGSLFFNGDRIDLNEYFKGNIVIIDKERKIKDNYLDLNNI